MKKYFANNDTDNLEFYSLEANWWVFALRGAASLVFGILALFTPITAVITMTIIFGIFTVFDGICSMATGISRARTGHMWGWLIFSGIIGIVAGVLALVAPHIASIGLTLFLWMTIAIRAIAIGIFEMATAIRLRKRLASEWLLAFSGLLSFIFGISILLLQWFISLPDLLISGGLFIGYNYIASGIILLWFAYKLSNRNNHEGTNSW